MKKTIESLRGMPDILPQDSCKWQYVERSARDIFRSYGYKEIRTPIMEETALFKRSIGEETDIVQKQMYSFLDRGERAVSLRPEGTASVIRAYLEHNLSEKFPIARLYYTGPMFRSERPQAGRNRQFYQIGVEAIGASSPYIDAEVITLMMKFLGEFGLSDAELKINSLGCAADKKAFEKILEKELAGEVARLCKDCAQRYKKNILRVFDCKVESCRQVLRAAPKITEHLCKDCAGHFDDVKAALDSVGVKYSVNPFLVRGLDYYTGTVFEVTHSALGSQDAVGAGGRYDGLIEEIGGKAVPACGFAVGMERLILAAGDRINAKEQEADFFLIPLGADAQKLGFKIISELRAKGIPAQMGLEEKSLKAQMRFADRVGAKKVVIIGDEELKKGRAILRDMIKKEQKEIDIKDVTDTHLW